MTTVLQPGRRVVLTEYAETLEEALEKHLHLVEQSPPAAPDLKPHEVLIRIRSSGVAWVDLLMTSGQYQHMAPPPYTPGLEFAGEVIAVGAGVDTSQCSVGDRVLSDFMKVGPRSYGDYQRAGGFATYAVVPADAVLPIPGDFSFDEAAVFLQAYETAYHCLVARGNLQRGETILINGATGLTGLASVQVAKLLGATVIATGRSEGKLQGVLEQGADHVVNVLGERGGVREFRTDVKQLTQGKGVDVVYDTVGGEVSLESLRCTNFGARFLIVGWTSTPNVARGRGQRGAPNVNMLPTNIIQMKQLSILGCPTVIAAAKDPSIRPARIAKILEWAKQGRIRPHVSQVFTLGDFKSAMLARWKGDVTGGCVVQP